MAGVIGYRKGEWPQTHKVLVHTILQDIYPSPSRHQYVDDIEGLTHWDIDRKTEIIPVDNPKSEYIYYACRWQYFEVGHELYVNIGLRCIPKHMPPIHNPILILRLKGDTAQIYWPEGHIPGRKGKMLTPRIDLNHPEFFEQMRAALNSRQGLGQSRGRYRYLEKLAVSKTS